VIESDLQLQGGFVPQRILQIIVPPYLVEPTL